MIREAYAHYFADQHTNSGDVVSLGLVMVTIMDYMPHATAVLSFFWMALRIWETETIKKLTGRWKEEQC